MELARACASAPFVNGTRQDCHVAYRATSRLSRKLHLFSCRRRWNHVTLTSAYSDLGVHEGEPNVKQTVSGSSEEADNQWNVDNDVEMLRLMEEFKGSFPIIRTYRNDLCTLEICGLAPRTSVLTAMASHKRSSAASNLLMRKLLTVHEVILPGSSGMHSTISTKLFAPSRHIVEEAKKLSLLKGISAGASFHKLFEAVQMLRLSKFYIELNAPGTSRDMSVLKKEERVQIVYSIEASSISALDQIGRAISLYAVSAMRNNASGNTFPSSLNKLWNKYMWIPDRFSSVRFRVLSVEEIEDQAKLINDATSSSGNAVNYKRPDRLWWPAPPLGLKTAKRCLDKATEDWIYENVPMHRMHIDPGVLDTQEAGNATLLRHSKEINLTHAQLVDLAGIFELYYEDRFTLSDKSFQSGATLDFNCVSRSKMDRFLEAITLGSIILGASIFAWLVAARLGRPSKSSTGNLVLHTVDVALVSKSELPLSGKNNETNVPVNEQLPAEEMEFLCKLIADKLVKALSWNAEVQSCEGKGAWTVQRSAEPEAAERHQMTLKEVNTLEEAKEAQELFHPLKSESFTTGMENLKAENNNADNRQGIIKFQVTLSRDRRLLGFQPLNEAAVSRWGSMPFAEELHNAKKLWPGFLERPLKFRGVARDVVVLELHMDPASCYAVVKPSPL